MLAAPDLKDKAAVRNYLAARLALDKARREHPWYDSVWLVRYLAAKSLIARLRPAILEDFVASFAALRTRKDFEVVDVAAALDDATLETVRRTVPDLPADAIRTNETERFGRMLARNQPLYTTLQKELEPLVSDLVGEPVEASYNFLSLYSEFGVCEPHMDAPNAKWTLDICLAQSKEWPIYFSQVVDWPEASPTVGHEDWQAVIRSDASLRFEPKVMTPGRAVIFSGSSQWHYRDALPDAQPGDFCNLLFFHFLPAGMREICRPSAWAGHFGVPELAWVAEDAGL